MNRDKEKSLEPPRDYLLKEQAKDRDYFIKHFPELLKNFPGKYVAIRNQIVVDSNVDIMALIGRIRAGRNRGKRYFIEKADIDNALDSGENSHYKL